MAGTALAGGVLMALGAMVSRPRQILKPRWLKAGGALAAGIVGSFMMFPVSGALAACTLVAGTPDIVTCNADSTAGFWYHPGTAQNVIVNADMGSPSGYTVSDGLHVDQKGAANTVDVNVNSDSSHHITINDDGVNSNSTTNAIDVEAPATGTTGAHTGYVKVTTGVGSFINTTGSGTDGIHVQEDNANSTGPITITSNSTMNVRDDGIHVDERGATSTGKVIVNNYGAITAGVAGGSSDWNGISVETTGAEIAITTSGAGTINMSGGGQSAIWAKSATGVIGVDVGADIGASGQTTGGSGVLLLSGTDPAPPGGGDSYTGGNVTATLEAGKKIYANGGGIVVGQESTGSTSATIQITNLGSVTSGGNGVWVGGFSGSGVYESTAITGRATHSSVTFLNEGDGSSIDSTAGAGVSISVGGTVGVTNQGSIVGLSGVTASTTGTSDTTLTNTGHIQGTAGAGSVLSGGDGITVNNQSLSSMIGTTNGQEIFGSNTATYDNGSGLTAGLGTASTLNSGLYIHDIAGVTTTPPQYAVTVSNTVEAPGTSGGIIVGEVNGVSAFHLFSSQTYAPGVNGVLIDNSGSGYGPSKKPGGLIVGVSNSGDGVSATQVNGDVTIDNSDTRNGKTNNLSSTVIDPLVGYDNYTTGLKDTLLDQLTTYDSVSDTYTYNLNYVLAGDTGDGVPTPPSGGISTGIWGAGNGVYGQGIAGAVSVDNSDGQIFGDSGDGITLTNIGTAVTTPGTTVVDIDNSDHGLIEGTQVGVYLSAIQNGNVLINNEHGATLGGFDGIEGTAIAGNVSIENEDGNIRGSLGDGILLTTVTGGLDVENNTNSWFAPGGYIFGGEGDGISGTTITGPVTIGNAEGVIGGAEGDGIHLFTIGETADGISGSAIDIENGAGVHTTGGIIVGTADGIAIDGVGTNYVSGYNNVVINNNGYRSGFDHKAGGLIVSSGEGDAIGALDIVGNLTIDNSDTRNNGSHNITTSGWGAVTTDVHSLLSGLSDATGDDFLPSSTPTTGIWGLDGNGVYANQVWGAVSIDNSKGQIGGLDDNNSGIDLSDIGSHLVASAQGDAVNIDNSNGGSHHRTGGLITGGDFGVRLSDIQNGDVVLNNDHGTIYGDEMGFALGGDGTESGQGLIGGNVYISNVRGLIEGSAGTDLDFGGATNQVLEDSLGAITINGVQASEGFGGNVFIDNGSEGGWGGGTIVGIASASAISIGSYLDSENNIQTDSESGVDTAGIFNGRGGLIIGSGTAHEPVILLNTSTNVNSSESGDDTFYWANGGVENYGIIASTNLAGFTDPDAGNGTGNLRPVYEARSTVRDDLFDSSLGSSFVVDGDFTDALVVLNEGGVAGDHLITSTVGGVEVDNDYHGILFGTVDLTGSNGTGESGVGNSIWNYGSWFTEGLNTLTSTEGDSSINNEGLIQTAFGSESDVPTTFDVANFYNDSPAPNENGYLSMVDGLADNDIVVTGNFWGSQDETLAHSYLAVDAYLASATDTDPVPTADQLHIDGSVTGTTGIIVNNTNTDNEGMGPNNTPGILVVSVAGEDPGACVDLACQDGDSFYISSKSANYLDVNGHGAIQQGLYAWYLHNQEDEGGSDGLSDYYLVTAALPTATSTPEVLTAFDNIFFDGVSGVVSDHLYGDHFAAPNSSPNTANSGGDVPPLGNADDHSKTNAAVWGRVAGSWSTQDSSYSSTYGGDFDTSFRQNTYTLLGGVDMSPNGDGDGLRFGAYGGYLGSNQNFDNYGTTGKYTGGVIGGYAAYTSGGFYADAQVNADLLSVKYDATLGTPVDATTTGTTIGVMANVGDRMYSGKNFFEPVASFGYATTNLNSFQSGTATVDFSNGQSVRAGAGARIGTTMAIKGGTLVEFALLGKIWDEFSGNNTVTITDSSDPGNPDTFTNDTGGVFGEVSGSATLFDPKTNVSTYLSAGGTFKSDATSWNAKLGLRKGF